MFLKSSFILLLLLIKKTIQIDRYHEELLIKPLTSTGHVNAFFQFSTEWKYKEREDLYNTRLVSRSIADLLLDCNIKELHVSLTNGLWRYEKWGYPVVDAAPGAEVLAWFDNKLTQDEIDHQWKYLCGALSGLLCASFSFMDKTNTISPIYSLRPQYSSSIAYNNSNVRYSTLPREIVCTENLTPWKKLLPCSQNTGFDSLLNSGYIHSTNYHSLGIHIRTLCDGVNDENCQLELKQTMNLVFDTRILSVNGKDWSIRRMFGQGLFGTCIESETGKIYVDITDMDFQLTPQPDNIIHSQRGGSITKFAEYDIKQYRSNTLVNIAAVYHNDEMEIVKIAATPPLYAKRFILGVGQERGKIVTKITNTHWAPLKIVLQENVPWFVPIYLHTLTLKCNGQYIKPISIQYIPGKIREKHYLLEIAFLLKSRSTIDISIDFDYIFLKWLEYPPDANHGHYIGSAIISSLLPVARNFTSVPIDGFLLTDCFNATRNGYLIQMRTEALLITLPTPDFSMPYNVICLACTVVALAFGPLHNITTKNIIMKDANDTDEPKTLFQKLKRKLFGKKIKTE